MRTVALNEGLQKISMYAFAHCFSLSTITLPSTLREIDNNAFYNCRNLGEVILHGVPMEMGKEAFSGCISLERFAFPTISSSLNALIQTGHWEEIDDKINEVRGVVERSDNEMFVPADNDMGEDVIIYGEDTRNWSRVRECLNKLVRLISYYEIKEGTSIFELALWKFKLDQVVGEVDRADPATRKKCRMDVPGPVKDTILQYLS